LYGFKCISRGEDKGAFYHPRFRRGDWEVVKKITRYAPQKKSGEGLPFYDGSSNKIPTGSDGSVSSDLNNTTSTYNGSGSTTYALPKPMFASNQPAATGFNNGNGYRAQPFQFIENTGTSPWGWDTSMNNHHSSFGMDFNPQHAYMYNNAPYHQAPQEAMSAACNSQTAPYVPMPSNTSDSGMSVEDTPRASVVSSNSTVQKPSYVQVNSNHVVTINPYFDVDAELEMFFEHDIPNHRSGYQSSSSMPGTVVEASAPAEPVKVERCEIGVNTDLSQAAGNLQEMYDSCGDLVSLQAILQSHVDDVVDA